MLRRSMVLCVVVGLGATACGPSDDSDGAATGAAGVPRHFKATEVLWSPPRGQGFSSEYLFSEDATRRLKTVRAVLDGVGLEQVEVEHLDASLRVRIPSSLERESVVETVDGALDREEASWHHSLTQTVERFVWGDLPPGAVGMEAWTLEAWRRTGELKDRSQAANLLRDAVSRAGGQVVAATFQEDGEVRLAVFDLPRDVDQYSVLEAIMREVLEVDSPISPIRIRMP